MEKIDPVEHGAKMFEIFVRDGDSPRDAVRRAIMIACEEYAGRLREKLEEYNLRVDPKTGLLR